MQTPADPCDHPVIDPYRATPESTAHAKAEAAREREEHFKTLREDELRKLDAVEALGLLVDEFGASRVQFWLRNVAALKGESL